jgi:hypothetical protein
MITLKDLLGKKVGIDFMLRHLTKNTRSHEASWIYLRCNQLKRLGINCEVIHDSIAPQSEYHVWDRYDYLFQAHGMAVFPDADKAFGSVPVKITDTKVSKKDRGAPPPVNVYDIGVDKSAYYFERLAWPQHDDVKYISMDIPFIPYGTRCRYKAPRDGTSQTWKNVDWEKVQTRCDKVTDWCIDPLYDYGDKNIKHRMIIGDSHAHSAYKPDSIVLRKDGRTMHSIINKGVLQEITAAGFDLNRIGDLTCYYGSIDVRHHLCRQDNPVQATRELLAKYEEALLKTERKVELVKILPIEDESRVIPKMGWYKGLPFYGTRLQRIEVLKAFNDGLDEIAARRGFDIFSWPKDWYEMDPIEFFQLMEVPRSVHLGWKYYRWDLINDCPNSLHNPTAASTLLEF